MYDLNTCLSLKEPSMTGASKKMEVGSPTQPFLMLSLLHPSVPARLTTGTDLKDPESPKSQPHMSYLPFYTFWTLFLHPHYLTSLSFLINLSSDELFSNSLALIFPFSPGHPQLFFLFLMKQRDSAAKSRNISPLSTGSLGRVEFGCGSCCCHSCFGRRSTHTVTDLSVHLLDPSPAGQRDT